MQRQRSGLDLFPEPIDLNQGSVPNNTNMDSSPSWDNNNINSVQSRLPDYMCEASVSPNITTIDPSARFSGWDRGESSSGEIDLRDDSRNEDSKTRIGGWSSSSYNAGSGSENWFYGPFHSNVRSQVSQGYSSNRGSLNISRNHGHARESDSSQRVRPHNIYKPVHHETEQIPRFHPSSSNLDHSNTLSEHNDSSGSIFGTWGSSCKRKAVEGTSASSSSNPLTGKNVDQHHGTSCYNSAGNLTIPSGSGTTNLSLINHSEPPNSGTRAGMTPPFLNFGSRSNLARHEPVSNNMTPSVSSSVRNVGVNNMNEQLSWPTTALRTDPNGTISQPRSTRGNDSRRTIHSSPSPWNVSLSSQGGGSSSSSYVFEDANNNARTSRRNNLDYNPTNVPISDTRNNIVPPNQVDWTFAPSSSSHRNHFYGSRSGSSSNVRASSSSAWLPHQQQQHQTLQNHQQRFSEAAPWIPFPRIESSESGNNNHHHNNRRSHFGVFPSSSSNEAGSSSRGQGRPDQRSAAFFTDMTAGDDFNGSWHALTAIEERHRLIRQVLNAMRRGVHLQAEDYMIFDPYMDEFAELHDRHRDMRLDVDNMSYEELLALEERIGNVSTGLSEEKIIGLMKHRKHNSMETSQNSEPCSICQEEYIAGDAIGILDCAHEFHTGCIKQWLTQKNLCPICKMTALHT